MSQKNQSWDPMSPVRLDKYLSMTGAGTRSEVKKLLKQGQILINGSKAVKPEQKIIPQVDEIDCCGKRVSYEPDVFLLLYKPSGCVTATEDNRQKTVMDYIRHERKEELFPVGRLDIDTEGLLFLINDGPLAHEMLSPKHHVPKTYFVRTEKAISDEDKEILEHGVDIGEKNLTLPAELKILKNDAPAEANLTICEGKFHQVKRMFEARNNRVTYLKRIAMAGISLDPSLKPGDWRALTKEEIERLRRYVNEYKSSSV